MMKSQAVCKILVPPKPGEKGTSLLELIVSVMVLTVGLLGAAAAIGHALRLNTMSRNATNAKFTGVSMLEQMETLRNTRRLLFKQIANVGAVDNTGAPLAFAGFATGWQPVSINPGPDGIYGTGDDLEDSGPDGIYGTGDDFTNQTWAQTDYGRNVTITPLSSTLKKITITVRYPGSAGNTVELTCIGYLNDY